MTHKIGPITDWPEYDSKRFELTAYDDDGNAITSVSADEFEAYVVEYEGNDKSTAVIDETSSDVTITVQDASVGRVDVFFGEDHGIPKGNYWVYIVHDPAGNSHQTWKGKVRIDD